MDNYFVEFLTMTMAWLISLSKHAQVLCNRCLICVNSILSIVHSKGGYLNSESIVALSSKGESSWLQVQVACSLL